MTAVNKERLANRNRVAETPKYWVRLTRLCNNNCIFCLDREAQNGSVISFKTVRQQLNQGRRQGFRKLILSGGEPTLHPDYLRILKYGQSAGYNGIQTVTNGRMFAYRGFLKEAVSNGLTEITFSMHGHTRKLYESQSRIRGSFEQALAGLKNALGAAGLIVNIDIVINKINLPFLDEIIRFYIGTGVSEFDLLHTVPFGSAWENRKKVFYDPARGLAHLHRAFALQKEFPRIYLWTNRLPAVYMEGFEELIQHPFKLKDEVRGRRKMLDGFIRRGKLMNCYGERCAHCFFSIFCDDLIDIRKAGILHSRPNPPCLDLPERPLRSFSWKGFRLEKFLDFFIDHRYYVKSFRCRLCRHDRECGGMQINYIREHGFRVLVPVRK